MPRIRVSVPSRFCKLDTVTSLSFRLLPSAGDQSGYAVQNMVPPCPSGARRVIRREDNEDWADAKPGPAIDERPPEPGGVLFGRCRGART